MTVSSASVRPLCYETYRNVTQDGQKDVDEEVGIASALEKHAQGRKDDGKDNLDEVAVFAVSECLWYGRLSKGTDLAVKGMVTAVFVCTEARRREKVLECRVDARSDDGRRGVVVGSVFQDGCGKKALTMAVL
jgi:hypothetical protein